MAAVTSLYPSALPGAVRPAFQAKAESVIRQNLYRLREALGPIFREARPSRIREALRTRLVEG